MSTVIEHPVFKVARLNTIVNPSKPDGWYIREKIDAETNKSVSLELGAYLSDEVFISIPVHFSMKHLFSLTNPEKADKDYKYYLVPMQTEFGVSTYISKRTNLENAILVRPNEEHPTVFLACGAISSKTAILGCKFDETSGVKVLKRYIDKDRRFVGFIAFVPAETSTVTCTVTEGIPNTTSLTTYEHVFDLGGVRTETKTEKAEKPVQTQFIGFPMFIEPPKKEKEVTEDNPKEKRPYQPHNNNFDKDSDDEKPRYKKPYNKNGNNRNFKDYGDAPRSNKNDHYSKKKNFKNNRNRRDD